MTFAAFLEPLLVFAFGLPRMIGVFVMIPIFNQSVLPGRTRMSVIVSLVLFLFPVYSHGVDLEAYTPVHLGAIMFKEAVIGLLMGFGLSVIFWAVESAGFFIDNQRGSTMASSVDPLTGSQTSPLGIFLMQVITVFFMIGGGFFVTLLAVYESYTLLPVFEFMPRINPEGAVYFISILDRIMALAVVLAAPALVAMFLAEFGLGLVSRFAPQLNVFFLSMPVKSAVGIFVLILYVGSLREIWDGEFATLPTHITVLSELLR